MYFAIRLLPTKPDGGLLMAIYNNCNNWGQNNWGQCNIFWVCKAGTHLNYSMRSHYDGRAHVVLMG